MPAPAAAEARAKVMWRMKLHSAIRTAVACTIIGTVTLYGPKCIRSTVTFPAFSYLTAILILSSSSSSSEVITLGDVIRGCCHAFYAILQFLPISVLSLIIIRRQYYYYNYYHNECLSSALMVVLACFVVGLPESTPLLTKRIAFGEIVILFVDIATSHGNRELLFSGTTDDAGKRLIIIMFPLRIASSICLGALSSLLAFLLPYPRLAHSEVRRLCQLYAEIGTERLIIYVMGLTAERHSVAVDLISQSKPLSQTGTKLLHTITTLIQESVMWERKPWHVFLKSDYQNSQVDRLLGFETSMRGMEIALNYCHLPTSRFVRQQLTHTLLTASLLLRLKQKQPNFNNFNSMEVQELLQQLISKKEFVEKLIFPQDKDQPPDCFFNNFAGDQTKPKESDQQQQQQQPGLMMMMMNKLKEICRNNSIIQTLKNKERLLFASKCSLSLGLAVLIGLMFKRENGYWSGLTIAISIVEGRQAIFTAANARAQGTAIGSVYGVLGCFVFENLMNFRFLALLPWIIFTSFLKHSQMYGQSGGISAVTGALLILGRKNYGPPEEFAIARLTEAMIGLCSFILIELLLQPTRAATLAKKHLYLSLVTLQESIKQILVSTDGIGNDDPIRFQAFRRNHESNLKSHIHDLQSYIAEAELEPNFWFLPFRAPAYHKVQDSLSKISVVLSCMTHTLEFLSQNYFNHWEEIQQHIHDDLEICKEILSTSLRGIEKSTKFSNSIPRDQEESREDKTIFQDKEKGIDFVASRMEEIYNDDHVDIVAISFLNLVKEVEEHMRDVEGGEEVKAKIIFSLSALGFCVGCLVNEIKNVEKGIKKLLYWEDP